MTDPIRPIRPIAGLGRVVAVSRAGAGQVDPERASELDRNLPVPVTVSVSEELGPQPVSEAAYAAQIMGQGGQKRGLRGGRETLDRARSTYLETEWSGPSDRRIAVGRITKTDI